MNNSDSLNESTLPVNVRDGGYTAPEKSFSRLHTTRPQTTLPVQSRLNHANLSSKDGFVHSALLFEKLSNMQLGRLNDGFDEKRHGSILKAVKSCKTRNASPTIAFYVRQQHVQHKTSQHQQARPLVVPISRLGTGTRLPPLSSATVTEWEEKVALRAKEKQKAAKEFTVKRYIQKYEVLSCFSHMHTRVDGSSHQGNDKDGSRGAKEE